MKNPLKALCAALNNVIHTSNLYRGHSRYIHAKVEGGQITVENLQTGDRVPFDGVNWRDGRGYSVTRENIS